MGKVEDLMEDDLLINALVECRPSRLVHGAEQMTHVDKVELVAPCPRLGDIVHLKDTIWGCPLLWRREEVYTTHGNWAPLARNPVQSPSLLTMRILIRNIQRPFTSPRS